MNIIINNQKPMELSPYHHHDASTPFDLINLLKEVMIDPIFNHPLITTNSVNVTIDTNAVTDNDMTISLISILGDTLKPQDETLFKLFYKQALLYFDENTPLPMQEFFAVQSAVKSNLPFPSNQVIYTPATDVIPITKQFLAGTVDFDTLFATYAFYTNVNALAFSFTNNITFDNFKQFVDMKIQALIANNAPLHIDVINSFQEFQTLNLQDLTQSLILRQDKTQNNEEYSFARLLLQFLMEYKTINSNEFNIMPFHLRQLFIPETLIFINLEKHSKSVPKKISNEWALIQKSIQMNIKVVNPKALNNLTAAAKTLQKTQAAILKQNRKNENRIDRKKNLKFKKTQPTSKDYGKVIQRLLIKMINANMSDNVFKYTKPTFAKPNRRDPDDFNKQGKMMSTKYKPDIHIYLDTSGSVSEDNYQSTVKMLIKLARLLNINLYFNSFSSRLSTCSKLNIKGKSVAQAYYEFQKIPKVGGGTDYEPIWGYINQSKKRQKELSVLITDFEYYPPSKRLNHPKNLYYMPLANMGWNDIKYWAENFCKSMTHIDPNIRQKLLM